MTIRLRYSVAAALGLIAAVAFSPPANANGPSDPGADNCSNADGAFDQAAFVIATVPDAGDRVSSGFVVLGCSRTFESTVNWRLTAPDGSELNSGFTQGGGVDGPGPFQFTVPYSIGARGIGHLEVFEEDVSDGEGNPPGRTVLPLVLQP